MANPQKENGYTAIANEIMDVLARSYFNPREWCILMYVLRKTWGFNKSWDVIPLSQFAKGCVMDKRLVCRILASLVARKTLLKEKNGYSFNKNYEQWVVARKTVARKTVARKITGSGTLDNLASGTADTLISRESKVDYSKVDSALAILEQFNALTGKAYRMTPEKKNQISARLANFTVEDCIQAIKNRLADPDCMGKNASGKIWAYDWNSLFRNDANLDRALNLQGSVCKDDNFYISELQRLRMHKFIEVYGADKFGKYSYSYNPTT